MAEQLPRAQGKDRHQVAALPWRRGEDGLQILLITSRETRRWVTPKGGRMAGKSDAEAAAQEALEEAGAEGRIDEAPFGAFRYQKMLKRRAPRWCTVAVYPLEVEILHDEFKERAERIRQWMSADQAALSVDEPDLRMLILRFSAER